MTRKVTSITKQGKTEPFYLQVAERQIAFHKSIFKFGFNPDIDNVLETVWAQGGLYTYLTSASTLYVSSSSANDTAAGTGAQNVTISGLDADYNEVSVTVDLNGQTAVQLGLANNWIRVNRGSVNTSGATGSNEGVIYVGTEAAPVGGVPATPYATIAIGDNQTLMALWTVPANFTAYVLQTDVTVATTQNNKYATVHFLARPDGGVFQVKDKFVIAEGSHHQEYAIPLKFNEKTDIEFRAIGDSVGADIAISAGIDILYVLNGDSLDVKNGN